MAKLKVKNLKNIQNKIRRKITSTLRQKPLRDGVGEIIVNEIQDGSFGAPSESYREWREMNDGLNKTDSKYSRNNINITFTGELLNDLKRNVKADFSNGKAEYIIEHSDGIHKPYKTRSGKTKRVSYKTISEGVRRYYDYLVFKSDTRKKILKFIRTELFKRIR